MEPAIVMGDVIQGMCKIHLVPLESGGTRPAGPLPFASPLTKGLSETVLIGGKPAAVMGSSGINTPPHPPAPSPIVDPPFANPMMQEGRITGGSATVFFGGKPAAKSVPPPTMCVEPGTITGSAVDVQIGG